MFVGVLVKSRPKSMSISIYCIARSIAATRSMDAAVDASVVCVVELLLPLGDNGSCNGRIADLFVCCTFPSSVLSSTASLLCRPCLCFSLIAI